MNQENFVERTKMSLRNCGVQSLLKLFTAPPGRKPRKKTKQISEWYNNLSVQEKEKVQGVVEESIDFTIFSFFCILDHVRFLENEEDKTTFELYAIKNGQKTLLNDPTKEELHNIYNSLTQEPELKNG